MFAYKTENKLYFHLNVQHLEAYDPFQAAIVEVQVVAMEIIIILHVHTVCFCR